MTEHPHEPLSFLMLERYVLGELTDRERAEVERRLAHSPEDRACLDEIVHDRSELPPLPLPAPRAPAFWGATRHGRRGWAALGGVLAVAAALALALLGDAEQTVSRRLAYDGTKGGEVAISLYGARQGPDPTSFAGGDRFKVSVTCPTFLEGRLYVLVFQGGQRYQPLRPAADFVCGNGVPWPGAFSLDGDMSADVCITWEPRADRRDAARQASDLEPAIVCKRLSPR